MKKSPLVFVWRLFILGLFLSWGYASASAQEKALRPESDDTRQQLDIVMVLDNSGSMKQNDPKLLTREVVTNFIAGFEKESRLAMIIFDRQARMVEPLTDLSGMMARARFLKSLEQVNYRGLYSDSPAAVERAVYELKLNSSTKARKVIILLTDGIVDTGDRARDLEKAKWLKEDLAQECRNSKIRIFSIAFTEKADFSLMQTLAFKTNGAYFRAFEAEDIQKVFNEIDKLINRSPSAATLPSGQKPAPEATKDSIAASSAGMKSAPLESRTAQSNAPPAETEPAGDLQKTALQIQKPSSLLLFILIGIFVLLAVIAVILFLNRRARAFGDPALGRHRKFWPASLPRAELIDVKNITGQETLKLGKVLIKIGRDPHNDVVVSKETVSSFHATIEYADGFFYLEDHRSKNKTFLNDEEVAPYAPKKLKSGDVIKINIYKFIFILPDLLPAGETVIEPGARTDAVRDAAAAADGPVAASRKAAAMPQAMLIDVKNIGGKKTVFLNKNVNTIGRGVHNDIAIDRHSISGSHAVIQYKDGVFFLEDQRSRNKTYLNGEEIAPHTPIKLKSGDEILFDTYKFIFLLEQQTPSGDTDESW